MIVIEVKPDKARKWTRLSVRLRNECSWDVVVGNCQLHMAQYAIDNNLNVYKISARAVDETTDRIIYNLLSARALNSRL